MGSVVSVVLEEERWALILTETFNILVGASNKMITVTDGNHSNILC